MKQITIKIEIPLTFQEIEKGHQYIDFVLDYDILKSRKENLEYSSQGNKRIMFLCDSLPTLISDMLTGGILEIHESRQYNNLNKTQQISAPNFPSFQCEINTSLDKQDSQNTNNEVIELDVINEELEYFRVYQQSINQRVAANCKIQNIKNWKQEFQTQGRDISYSVNQISLTLPFGEASQILETELIEAFKKYYLYYYKSMLITYNKWSIMDLDQIKKKQQSLVQRINKKSTNPKHVYKQIVQNYSDLTQKTAFLEVRQRFSKLLNQSISDISQIQGNNFDTNSYVNFGFQQNSQLKNNLNGIANKLQKNNVDYDHLSSYSQVVIKKNLIRKKAGTVYKKGDGPIDYKWNSRYLVLDCETLMYFKTYEDKIPRGFIKLKGCNISEIQSLDDREFTFNIESFDPQKKLYFSCDTKEETESWREDIFKAINNEKNLQKTESKNKNLPIIQPDENMIHKNFQTTTFPDEFQNYRQVMNNIQANIESTQQENNEWIPCKYRNGVRIYNKLSQLTSKKKKFDILSILQIVIPITIAFLMYYFVTSIPTYQRIAISITINLIIRFILSKFQKKQSDINQYEIASKVILDEECSNIFTHLKKNSFKQKIDFNLVSQSKPTKESQFVKNTEFQYQFETMDNKSKNTKNQQINIQTNCQKVRFIHNSGKSYIMFNSKLQQNTTDKKNKKSQKKFNLIEIFSLEKYPKFPNKTLIYYYSNINTSMISQEQCQKIQKKRSQQLAVLREVIKEEETKQIQISQIQNQNSNQIVATNGQGNHDLPKVSKTCMKLPDSYKKSYEDYIQLVDILKTNKTPTNAKRVTLEDRKPGYKRMKEGGIGCYNKEEIKSQEGLISDLVKSFGKQLFEGKNIVSISLPVRIFEPRSTIERICENWSFMPIYLKKASQTKEPLERFKLAISFAVAGLYTSCKQQKPFNPILGETFQGFYADGTKIDIEHSSHHPPVSHFYLEEENKKYKFYGHYEYKAKVKGTSVIGKQQGPQTVVFSDGHTITWEYPDQRINGLLYGTRVLEWFGSMKFTDKTYKYSCELKFFDYSFLNRQHPSDYFSGTIHKEGNPEEIYSKVEGSWLEYIEFDGQRYWDLNIIHPCQLIHTTDPLDSDCRYREDLIYLAKKDLDQSQEWKVKLEVLQRKDRAGRKEYKDKLNKQQ